MAALTPKFQQFTDSRNGYVVGVTKVTLVTTGGAGDTITLPQFSNTTASASVAQIRDASEPAATSVVSVVATGVVTVIGTAGQTYTLASIHPHVNYSST